MDECQASEDERRPFEAVVELLRDDEPYRAVAAAMELRPAELAELLDYLDSDDHEAMVHALPPEVLAPALEYLSSRGLEETVALFTAEELTDTISTVADDIATDMVQALDEDVATQVMESLTEQRRHELEVLLSYDEETAGGHMTGQVITVPPHFTAGETIGHLRQTQADPSQPFYLYVTDQDRHLLGVLSLRSLITSHADTPVGELMIQAVTVPAWLDQEETARLIQRHNLQSLPVVDDDGCILGAVTADDLIDVLQEEATEDIYRMAGVHENEDLRRVWSSVRHRLPWLVVNLGTALIAAWVVSRFEGTLARVAVLAAFMPVVGGQGGNAGIQTLTVVVRSLALGEVLLRDTAQIVWHEVRVGLTTGTATGLLVGLVAYLWMGNGWLGLVVGLALWSNVLVGVSFGVLIPMGLQRFDQDPALSAGIWLTMLTDVIGFAVYLGLATALLSRIA